jgi:hypothetical protein
MGEALQQREIDMHVEPRGLVTGEAIGDRLEGGAHGVEMVEPLAQAEVGEIVGDQFVAQKGQELLILFEEACLEVGAEDLMAVLGTASSLSGHGVARRRASRRRAGCRHAVCAALREGRAGGGTVRLPARPPDHARHRVP